MAVDRPHDEPAQTRAQLDAEQARGLVLMPFIELTSAGVG